VVDDGMNSGRTIAVVGGTGALGAALAWRLARIGHRVVIGSRNADRAEAAVHAIKARLSSDAEITGQTNADAAAAAEVVFVTVPFSSQAAIVNEIKSAAAGKLVVDATVPLVPPKVATFQMPPHGSAAVAAQRLLGDDVTDVSALHNVAAHKLGQDDMIECDVLVFGNKAAARQQVIDIITAIGLRGIHAGALANSIAAEAMTSVLIGINRRYSVDGAGIKITGHLIDEAAH
jgi:8-hydroxy-5-deazaflavin:NADPH oxidoreductase